MSICYLQANASAADLSETRFFDAWGLQASSWQSLAGQGANVVKGPAVVPTRKLVLGAWGLQSSILETWRPGGLEAWRPGCCGLVDC